MSVKVSIVEDDTSTRAMLSALVGGTSGFGCAGVHGSAECALKALPVERPEVLLLDLELPRMSGEDFIREVKDRWPAIEILVFTIHDDPKRIFRALEAGACGYLVKPVPPARILEAISDARAGGAPMSSQIARLVVKTFHQRGKERQSLEKLTAREEEVLQHLAKGYQTKEIADMLNVSDRTIGTHLRNIYEKLHVRSRSAAVAKYLR